MSRSSLRNYQSEWVKVDTSTNQRELLGAYHKVGRSLKLLGGSWQSFKCLLIFSVDLGSSIPGMGMEEQRHTVDY